MKHQSTEETPRDMLPALPAAKDSQDSPADRLINLFLEDISEYIDANLESFVLDGIENLACREAGLTNVRKLLEQYE